LPVLNIADLYIVAGLAALVWGVDTGEKRKTPQAAQTAQAPGDTNSSPEEARR